VGTVRLVPFKRNNPYTGLFEDGADFGIVRLSESQFIAQDAMDANRFSPSVALKFFVDGKKSRNLLTQVNFDGVEDGYFFENNFTNHPPRSTNECMQKTVEKKFADASMFTFSTGTSHLSTVFEDGTEVPCEEANFPYEVILVPNRDAFPKEDMEEGEDMLDFFEKWNDGSDNGKVKLELFRIRVRHDPSDDRPVDKLPAIGIV